MDLETYLSYSFGTIPIIISVPHGGVMREKLIQKRKSGILGIDRGTIELARNLIKKMEKRSLHTLGKKLSPSYIISYIHRNRIDFNRPKRKAFVQDSELAENIYDLYHQKIAEFIEKNIEEYGKSLLIDIHGFERDSRPEGFRNVDLVLGTLNLKSLFIEELPKKEWGDNIRGKLVEKLGDHIPIAPGHPRRKEYVLKGGYITKRYGALKIARSQSMQMEFSDKIRLYDNEAKNLVLEKIADLLLQRFKN